MLGAVAIVVTTSLAGANPLFGVMSIVVVISTLLVLRPGVFIALTGLTIPVAPIAILPFGDFVIPMCDILAIAAIASLFAVRHKESMKPWASARKTGILRPVVPGILLALPYSIVAAVNTAVTYPGDAQSFAVILQRAEIVLVWLVFGAIVWRSGRIRTFLIAFVSATVLLSAFWMATPGEGDVYGLQKNSSGGYIASAILVVMLARVPNRLRIPLLIILTGGLVSTGSRGSMLGLVAALAVMMFVGRDRKKFVIPFLIAATAGVAAALVLPADMLARLFSANAAGQFNTDIRGLFIQDALTQWAWSPWTGVGVGNYQQRTEGLLQVKTFDPHNAYVLALTEGGYFLLAAFVLLIAGTLVWLLTKPKSGLVILAIGVQVSTLAHAYVDVYWVRGTPVMGWFLIGAAAAWAYGEKWAHSEGTDSLAPSKLGVRSIL